MQSIPSWSTDPVVVRKQLAGVVEHLRCLIDTMPDLLINAEDHELGDIEKDVDSAWTGLGIAHSDLSRALAKTTLVADLHKSPRKSRPRIRMAG